MSVQESVVVKEHLPCADCGSHDALCLYSDGHTYCFSCNAYHKGSGEDMETTETYRHNTCIPVSDMYSDALRAREIDRKSVV